MATAKKVGDKLREKYGKRVEDKLGVDLGKAPQLGDLLHTGARLHTEHVKAVLKFQRWVSDTVIDGLQGVLKDEEDEAEVALEGKLNEQVVARFSLKNPGPNQAEVSGYIKVRPAQGIAFYVDEPVPPFTLAGGSSTEVEVKWKLDSRKFKAGSYKGETVFEFPHEVKVSKRFQLQVRESE